MKGENNNADDGYNTDRQHSQSSLVNEAGDDQEKIAEKDKKDEQALSQTQLQQSKEGKDVDEIAQDKAEEGKESAEKTEQVANRSEHIDLAGKIGTEYKNKEDIEDKNKDKDKGKNNDFWVNSTEAGKGNENSPSR